MFYLLNPYNKPASWFMVAASGTYAVSGQAARLLLQHGLVAAAGSYSVGGQQVNLFKGVNLFAAQGQYDLTGVAVGLFRALRLPANQGSYAVSGQLVDFIRSLRVAAGFGAYSVTGLAAGIFATRQMLVGRGDYVLAGQDVALRKTLNFPADQGSYVLSGQDVSFRRDLGLIVGLGAYLLGGQDVQFNWNHPLAAAVGAYALSGQDVQWRRNFPVAAGQGSYGVSGQLVDLAYSSGFTLPADQGSYGVEGRAALLTRQYVITTGFEIFYQVTGIAAALGRQLSMAAGAGAFALAGKDANLIANAASVSFVSSVISTADLTTYNLTLPTAVGPGPVILIIGGRATSGTDRTFVSGNIGGNALTAAVQAASSVPSGGSRACIATATMGSSSTSISVTFSGLVNRAGVAAYNTAGLMSLSPTDTAVVQNGTTTLSANINVVARGIVVAAWTGTSGGDATWTNLTEGNDQIMEGNIKFGSGHGQFATAQTGLSVTQQASAQENSAYAVASFR